MLRRFRSGRIPLLVATDVMSRGIDIKEIDMVINFDAPQDAEDYVHRVGRTARANKEGEAVTLVNPKDMAKLANIQRLIEAKIPVKELPKALGKGPEWNEKKKHHSSFKNKKKYHKKNNSKRNNHKNKNSKRK